MSSFCLIVFVLMIRKADSNEIKNIFDDIQWPDQWPYTAADFKRADETDDFAFYHEPRLVTHIDDRAIDAIHGVATRGSRS